MAQRFSNNVRWIYSDMSGELFRRSVKYGYDSEKFVKLVCLTDYGHLVFDDIRANEWLADTHVMEGFKKEFKIPKGQTYNPNIMYFVGYLYRYWGITEDKPIKEIYNMAPLDFMVKKYGFYHTQGEEYVIEDIKRINRENNKMLGYI